MRGLDPSDLLEVADHGHDADWIGRGLLLVACAWPDASPQQRGELPIGARDRLVMALRIHTFGPTIELVARCVHCGADLEATVDLTEVLAAHRAMPPEEISVEVDGTVVTVRNPTSTDVQEAIASGPDDVETALLDRCLGSGAGWAEARAAAARALAEADPLADLRFELRCEVCGEGSSAPFDIVSSFWTEIETGAGRMVREVHDLARVYGWSEADILAMPGSRRARYLAMIR